MIAGQPLIAYTIQAAARAVRVDRIYLSSDDEAILSFGRNSGVEAICRPEEYASDSATAMDVVRHFLSVLPDEISRTDPYILYLQPTSPLRTAEHIDQALAEMETKKAHALISVIELAKSPFKSFQIDTHGNLQSLFDERLSNVRRQDLPKAYIPNGAIYVFRLSEFLVRDGFPSNGSLPFVMSDEESVDIDTEDDIRVLERYLGERHG
jgi:CMP-N-acetylneuraminic acid synthetase